MTHISSGINARNSVPIEEIPIWLFIDRSHHRGPWFFNDGKSTTMGNAIAFTIVLAMFLGRTENALDHFGDARNACRKAGFRMELAWTDFDLADALLQQDAPGDSERAMTLLDDAIALSSEMGMLPLNERATLLKSQKAARPSDHIENPAGLSSRELEVLVLVAAGKTNQEIGEHLFISSKTVAQHVTNILNKTGAANRTGAAIYASKQGLVPNPRERR